MKFVLSCFLSLLHQFVPPLAIACPLEISDDLCVYVQSCFLEVQYTLKRILQMDVGATNTTKEQKSMNILEMTSSRNEHQKLLLHDELQYKNIHNVLAPYFPLKNT